MQPLIEGRVARLQPVHHHGAYEIGALEAVPEADDGDDGVCSDELRTVDQCETVLRTELYRL